MLKKYQVFKITNKDKPIDSFDTMKEAKDFAFRKNRRRTLAQLICKEKYIVKKVF